ncbi:4-amino-4-deoxy-L-arabinose transferase-like glycosyltransferase [Streptomyces sp. B4I13]|uniref:PLD nuclease N-terminal domain-containing protein n=1 Tax=Streptomyces sp. B4I13 TaxID=3042271 RepID=UPI00278B41B7|nr:PLD nuclease N-terminal domain-containing protein [Streptomyces sp. B4I13]MDQ0960731.1 4-amino-4-deoxy-L-arabinose transferase-like glycosyltransferase [Streptomyces sp. B4I13]
MQTQLVHHMTLAATSVEVAGAAVTLAFILCGFAAVVLFISALVSILKSRLTGGMKLVWIVFAFAAPFLGSLCWFVIGRKDAQRRPGVV